MFKVIFFFVGSYTLPMGHAPDAAGEGIYSCNLDPQTGNIELLSVFGDIENPTFLARQGKQLFAAGESPAQKSSVSLFKINSDQSLTIVHAAPTAAAGNSHVSVFEDRVLSASYSGGLLDVLKVTGDRLETRQSLRYFGSGPDRGRQEASHAHQAVFSPDQKWIYVCDLGSDTIWIHANSDQVNESPAAAMIPAGYGPRHLAFHPSLPLVYVATELNAHLLTMVQQPSTGQLTMVQDIPTLPGDYSGQIAAAAVRVHPSGKAVYMSNRFLDSISAFSVNEEGRLTWLHSRPSGGKTPRDFNIDPSGNFMIVANQDSNNLVVYRLHPKTGHMDLEPLSTFEIKTPVNIVF